MGFRGASDLTADLILAGLKLSERDLLRDKFRLAGGNPPWGGGRLKARENFLADILADPELAEACRPFFPLTLPGLEMKGNSKATELLPPPDIFPWADLVPEVFGHRSVVTVQELAGEADLPLVLDFLARALALMAGAGLAGTAPLDERYLYTHSLDGRPIRQADCPEFKIDPQGIILPRRADRVLVLGFVRTPEIMGLNPALSKLRPLISWPNWPGQIAATLKMAAWIRVQGYVALPAAGGLLMADHLGVLAGLGELGRQGLLISPEYGPNLRLMTIITDFPFKIDRPAAFGVADYCDTCRRCINECPAKALEPDWSLAPPNSVGAEIGRPGTSGRSTAEGHRRPGPYQWPVNRRACFYNWLEKGDPCRKCIEICPYTREPLVGSPGGTQRPAP